MKIFISYARENQSKVEELQSILVKAGHNAWFDQEIHGGDDWWTSKISHNEVIIKDGGNR